MAGDGTENMSDVQEEAPQRKFASDTARMYLNNVLADPLEHVTPLPVVEAQERHRLATEHLEGCRTAAVTAWEAVEAATAVALQAQARFEDARSRSFDAMGLLQASTAAAL
jgi:hypothetical protein